MKILIIGPLGAGKSTLAYEINKKLGIPRLNLDEVCRSPDTGDYYTMDEQFSKFEVFLNNNQAWVAEGCQKYLYEQMKPDLIIDMRIPLALSVWRFTLRFFKAKKLIGKKIDKELPIQAYHYRKPTLKKIANWTMVSKEINAEITEFLSENNIKTIKCKSYKDYNKVFEEIA